MKILDFDLEGNHFIMERNPYKGGTDRCLNISVRFARTISM